MLNKGALSLLALATALDWLPAVGAPATQGVRSAAERAAFARHNPCPATSLRRGACPGFEVDHVVALCAGGADRADNMQWLSVDAHRLKSRNDRKTCRQVRSVAQH